jgi:hypothetical protein
MSTATRSDDLTPLALYSSGCYLLDGLRKGLGLQTEGPAELFEEVVTWNTQIDREHRRWDELYAAVVARAEQLEDVEWLVSLMDDAYGDILSLYAQEFPDTTIPAPAFLAQLHELHQAVAQLDEEHDGWKTLDSQAMARAKDYRRTLEQELYSAHSLVYDLSDPSGALIPVAAEIATLTRELRAVLDGDEDYEDGAEV